MCYTKLRVRLKILLFYCTERSSDRQWSLECEGLISEQHRRADETAATDFPSDPREELSFPVIDLLVHALSLLAGPHHLLQDTLYVDMNINRGNRFLRSRLADWTDSLLHTFCRPALSPR